MLPATAITEKCGHGQGNGGKSPCPWLITCWKEIQIKMLANAMQNSFNFLPERARGMLIIHLEKEILHKTSERRGIKCRGMCRTGQDGESISLRKWQLITGQLCVFHRVLIDSR